MTPSPPTVVLLTTDAAPVPGDERLDDWRTVLPGHRVVLADADDDWWLTAGLSPEDLVVLTDALWAPGPGLVPALARAGTDARGRVVVDARVLPIEVARPPVSDADEGVAAQAPDGAEPSVSAACSLVLAGDLAEVAPLWRTPAHEGRGAALAAWAAAAGVRVAVEPEAVVHLPVRVDADGSVAGLVGPAVDDPSEPPTSLHPAALPATNLSQLLDTIGLRPEPTADPGPARPFLTVVTRTQGTRRRCLEDTLTCLAHQTNRDFELLLVCHRTAPDAEDDVHRILERQPAWLQERARLVRCERPGRAAPLNDGFAQARGRYVVALDDDDTVLAHWVDTFAGLERSGPGRVLRAATLRQDVVPLEGHADLCPVPVGQPFPAWAASFDFVDHLRLNHSPCMSVAFPRGVVHHLGLRFDESLAANEDWELVVRAAGLVGVTSSAEVTSVYRWWRHTASSRELHSAAEWEEARDRVLASFDASVLVLPPGAATRFREVVDEALRDAEQQRQEALALATSQHEVIQHLDEVGRSHERTSQALREMRSRAKEAEKTLKRRTARFRRWTALMRRADELLEATGTRDQHGSVFDMKAAELERLIALLSDQPTAPATRARRLWPARRSSD